jgi:Uma2 family endonuclease
MPLSPTPNIETHRWTRRQYEQMVEAGVLTEDDPVELLNGQIVRMSPQSSRHATVVTLCHEALVSITPPDHFIRVQAPLALNDESEPEPDLALVPGRPEAFWTQHPTTATLIVEVADTSLAKDRETKRPVYARNGIPEYWIINLVDHCVEVYRTPHGDEYESKHTVYRGDEISDIQSLSASLPVSHILPST